MTAPDGRGPRPLGDVLGALFASKGLARLRAVGELEEAWAEAVGEPTASRTRVGGVRHGVLTVTVGHPTLLEELAAFRKTALLTALREKAPGVTLHDIRFRIGPVEPPQDGSNPPPKPPPTSRPKRPRRGG